MEGVEKKGYKEMIRRYNYNINKGEEKKDIKEKNCNININRGEEKKISNNKKESDNKNINISYNMDRTFKTFRLKYNSKFPSDEWAKDETKTYHINKHLWKSFNMKQLEERSEGRGIPCGKINGIWVLDLDLYIKEEKNPYDPENCLFRKTFGDPEEYIKKNNLFAVKSISGGIHIYYNYDNRFKRNSTSKTTHIDTRSDGGYIVAPFTKINNGQYKILNNGVIGDIDPELSEWVIENVINKKKKVYKPTNPKIVVKNPITNEEEEHNEQDIDLSVFEFSFSDYLINSILEKLPDNYYFEDYEGFLIFTTAMKQIGKKELWDKWARTCPDKYNKEQNEIMWNSVSDSKYHAINSILLASEYKNARTCLDYYKYKPVLNNTFNPDYVFNQRKLGFDSGEETFFYKHNDRVVVAQSDTGTGKTTEAKKYFKESKKPFLSIVSRISLGLEQVQIFKKYGLDCEFHETLSEMNKREGRGFASREGENIVITIDSLLKLQNWDDFEGYTIFLDEYNSLIEYLITCPLLNKSRQLIFPFFQKIINQADKVIATDADINEISLSYMKEITEFKYIKNEYKHNNGIEAEEIFSFESFIEKINKEDKWLIPCDSKTQSEIIAHINASSDYVLITSEGWFHSGEKRYLKVEERDMDLYDRIVFSPAIVYGLDSTIERPVYCYFKEHTISPVAMVQQICRCRNIKYLRFLFTSKKCKEYHYHSPEHAQQEIEEREEYGIGKNYSIDEETGARIPIKKNEVYNRLLSEYIYREDCYNTNKFAHFIQIIKSRGFKISMSFYQTKQTPKEIEELVKEEKESYFMECCEKYNKHYEENIVPKINKEIESYIEIWTSEMDELNKKYEEISKLPEKKKIYDDGSISYLDDLEDEIEYLKSEKDDRIKEIKADYYSNPEEYFSPSIIKVNDILKIPYNELSDHMNLILNPFELIRHFNITKYFNKTEEEIEKDFITKSDFNPNKGNTYEAKMLFLNKYRSILNMDQDIKNIEVKNFMNEKQSETFMKEYKIVFERFRGKKIPDFSEVKINQQYIVKMYKNLFGEEIINKKKTTKNKKSITYYTFNEETLDYHNKILSFRKKDE